MKTEIKVKPPGKGCGAISFILGISLIFLIIQTSAHRTDYTFQIILALFSIGLIALGNFISKKAHGYYEYNDVTKILFYKTFRFGGLKSFVIAKKDNILGVGVNTYFYPRYKDRPESWAYSVFIILKDNTLVELSDIEKSLEEINDRVVKLSELFDSPAFLGIEKMYPKIIFQESKFEKIDYIKDRSFFIETPDYCKDFYYLWTMRIIITLVIIFFLSLFAFLLWETFLSFTG
ncbi:MAG: hypothetical protein JXR70_14705 [Spirochaetales bacterium]|nr:hypothetical protein [Spirochaetales bacterium]